MRIGVISDTHGNYEAIKQAVKLVGTVDMWLHAGDYSQDGDYLAKVSGVRVHAAKGNCDGYAVAPLDDFVEVLGVNIWITHGHRYDVKYSDKELVWWAERYNADIVIYGHTHLTDMHYVENLLIFNPGSAAQPRCGSPTCGVLNIDVQGKITADTIELHKIY